MIKLFVEPKTPPMTWGNFVRCKKRAIALDGFVASGPRFLFDTACVNFNHHEGVSRLETRATCAQVLLALRMGLLDVLRNEQGQLDFSVYVNDCDEDVCLSVFLLKNSHLAINCMNPLLNRLVFMEDMLDTTAGAYPFPKDLDMLSELMWVFRPYHNFRVGGGLDRRNASEFASIIEDVGNRTMAYITGKGQKAELDTRYDVLSIHDGWRIVEELGPNARIAMYGDGIKAFLSVRKRPDGNYTCALGRTSQFIHFPIPTILRDLNKLEKPENDFWGGGDTTAGSPRIGGTKLPLETIVGVINGRMTASR